MRKGKFTQFRSMSTATIEGTSHVISAVGTTSVLNVANDVDDIGDTMDRPMGPRPDQRSAAYESIFGRPSVAHHQYGNAQPSSSLQPYRQPPYDVAGQGYYHQQQQPYPAQYDAQAAYLQPQPSQYGQQYPPPSAYRQSYYQPPAQPAYPVHNNHLSVSSQQQGYARSLASSSHSMGVLVSPPPIEPPDPNLESLTRAGMTPAQAYQAQVYSRNPNGQHPSAMDDPNHDFRSVSSSPPQHRPQSYADNHQPPKLGIQPPDPRIDIDFMDGELSGSSSTGDFASAGALCCNCQASADTHVIVF